MAGPKRVTAYGVSALNGAPQGPVLVLQINLVL